MKKTYIAPMAISNSIKMESDLLKASLGTENAPADWSFDDVEDAESGASGQSKFLDFWSEEE